MEARLLSDLRIDMGVPPMKSNVFRFLKMFLLYVGMPPTAYSHAKSKAKEVVK